MPPFTSTQIQEIIAGTRPLAARRTVTFDGGVQSGKLSTKAAFTTVLAGTNNDLVLTAHVAGVAGNLISVAYVDPKVSVARSIAVHVNGNAIIVELATANLTAATNTLTNGNATNVSDNDTVTINGTIYRFKNTPALVGDVKIGASADASTLSLAKTINGTGIAGTDMFAGTPADSNVSSSASVTSHAITLTAKVSGAAGNALTLAANAHNTPGAATFSGGLDGGQIISLASAVVTAIAADTAAAALLDTANSGGDDATGVVTAMAASFLTGGSDGQVPLFTVHGDCLVSLRGYVETIPTGTGGTLVHGKTGTTNDLITILTGTALTALGSIDSTGYVARGTAAAKTPLKMYTDGQTIFATVATHSIDTGKINYTLDYIPLSEGAYVSAT